MTETLVCRKRNINILAADESLLEVNTMEMVPLTEITEEFYRDASGFWRLKNGKRKRR